MAKRKVVDFKIINLSEEKFQELKDAGQIDPNALYTTPDTTKERLDTLEATTVNYGNITNCLTEIPQDIKLELTSDGKIIAKAGSKVYKPNGAEYTPTTIDQDISIGVAEATSGKFFLFVGGDRGYDYFAVSRSCSGTTDIYAGLDYHAWYDTTNNQIKMYRSDGTTVAYTQAFPCAIITTTNGKITSIDQVFNGFGYIGSTKHVLPGVKGLIPNGRNADGSLRNIEFATSSVMVFTGASTDSVVGYFNGNDLINYNSNSIVYDSELNRNINTATGAEVDMIPYTNIYHQTAGKIDYCTFKKPFHAVDYNDFENTKQELNAEIATVDSNAVHKTGAETIGGDKTFTGNIIKTNTVLAKRNVDNSYMEWFGGTQYNKGAYFRANGKDLAEDPGTFICSASDGVTFRQLRGFVDGTLLWDNQRVLTSGSAYGCPNYSAVVQIWSGWTAPSNGIVFGGAHYGDDLNTQIAVNGHIVFWVSTSHAGNSYGNVVVSKGDVITVQGGTHYFAPMK